MATTIDFLEVLKARNGGLSDYAMAKVLGITRGAISNYRHKRSFLDDQTAIQVAKLLEIEPGYVMASCHAERAKSEDEKAAWTAVLQRFADNDALFHITNCGADALRAKLD